MNMFEDMYPSDYPCQKCKYYTLQKEEKILNIDGIVSSTILWYPLCLLNIRNKNSEVILAIKKCKQFKNKN